MMSAIMLSEQNTACGFDKHRVYSPLFYMKVVTYFAVN